MVYLATQNQFLNSNYHDPLDNIRSRYTNSSYTILTQLRFKQHHHPDHMKRVVGRGGNAQKFDRMVVSSSRARTPAYKS